MDRTEDYGTVAVGVRVQDIARLLSLPALKLLYLNGLGSRREEMQLPEALSFRVEKSSGVEHFLLQNASMRASDLVCLLKRMKTLRSLSLVQCAWDAVDGERVDRAIVENHSGLETLSFDETFDGEGKPSGSLSHLTGHPDVVQRISERCR